MTQNQKRIVRTFVDIPEEGALSEHLNELDSLLGRSGVSWEELLESKRVLIFSEAGAGKTFECQAEQQRLWAAGEPAFFLELAQLAKRDLRAMLSPDEEARFDEWMAAPSDRATFFLDSYDELKLTLGSFKMALTTLAKALGGKLGRARVIVTSRPIPVDEQLFRTMLPVPQETRIVASEEAFADLMVEEQRPKNDDNASRPWRRVVLSPLTDPQIRKMAVSFRVADPDPLLEDIRRRNAQTFACRPQDLIELCADWRDHKRIRTHREQVYSNVQVKLRPRKNRQEKTALSYDRAVEGAQRLALAALLTRRLTFRHSAAADTADDGEATLDPASILVDWTEEDIETLLERPLFGFASYGRVRFHHRSVLEFLAAEHLKHLVSRGMTRRALNRILFASTAQNEEVVRPSMRPVAAWLAILDTGVFDEILRREPDLLLNAGDPETLTTTQRRRALLAYVDRYGPGGWRGMQVPGIQIHRFASQDLAATISEAWQGGIENSEVREVLLGLIAAGQIDACGEIAVEAACNGGFGYGERVDAIEALVAIKHPRLNEVLTSVSIEGELWNNRLGRWILLRLFSTHLTTSQSLALMALLREGRREVAGISWQLPQTIAGATLTPDALEALRAGMTDLVFEGVAWQESGPQLKSPREFLVSGMATVCHRLLASGDSRPELFRSIVIALRMINREYGEEKPSESLRRAIADADASIRAALFQADLSLVASLHPMTDPWDRFFETSYHGPVRLVVGKDSDWLFPRLANPALPMGERAVLLEGAIQLVPEVMTMAEHLTSLRALVADSPQLLARIDERSKPGRRSRKMKSYEARMIKREKRSARRALKDRASWIMFWREVARDPERVFKADRSDHTVWNLWRAMRRSDTPAGGSEWRRPFIEQFFDRETADRLRFKLMELWRKETPPLPSERAPEERGTYYTHWELALSGLAAEAEDAAWLSKLTEAEIALAVRYARLTFSSFPFWLEAIAVDYPHVIDRVLGPELAWELSETPPELGSSTTLHAIRQSSPALASLFLPRLWTWLEQSGQGDASEAGYRTRLDQVVEILLAFGDDALKAKLLAIAVGQFARAPEGSGNRIWLIAIFRMDPAQGVDLLEKTIGAAEVSKSGPGVRWFGALFGDGYIAPMVDLDHPGFTPDLMLRLVKLAYSHVQPGEDAIHEGTYSPDARDRAEQGRNAVLSALLAGKGTEAWTAKLALAADPLCVHFQDRIRQIARERSAEEADTSTAREEDVVTLNRQGELPPATRDDMYGIMVDRLDDLEDLLLLDDSPREVWASITDETVMRRELARTLRQNSADSYKVDQEAVTIDNKETDIRLLSLASDQQAVIELKLGEQPRSAIDLKVALRNQLLKKYLAPESRRAGCLLVTISKDRRWKHPATNKQMDLTGLIAFLNEEARTIEQELGGAVRIFARGLDLRPRLKTEKAS